MVHCWTTRPCTGIMTEDVVFFEVEVYTVIPKNGEGALHRYRTRDGVPHTVVDYLRVQSVLFKSWKLIHYSTIFGLGAY